MSLTRETLLSAQIRLPDHVVHRSFVAETVVLNLQTGKYHGLNPTGGQMLDALNETASVRDAATRIAEQYDQQQAVVEADLVAFCNDLLERQLITVVDRERS